MVTSFKIYGERCSGTNLLHDTIVKNFTQTHVADPNIFDDARFLTEDERKRKWNKCFAHKHFFGKHTLDDSDDTLFVCIVRDPVNWANSLYRTPHHVSQELTASPDAFVKGPFVSRILNPPKLMGHPVQQGYPLEIHENIFKLRAEKNKFLLDILPTKVKNYVLIKFEDLVDDFVNTMEKLKNAGLTPQSDTFTQIPKSQKTRSWMHNEDCEEKLPVTHDHFDFRYESSLGYNMIAPTGEDVMGQCDVCVYDWQYMKTYPSCQKHMKKLIVVGDPNPDPELIKQSKTFFTKLDWIHYFVAKILPEIDHPFELVTHNSDYTAGRVERILNHPHLVQWKGCNMLPHPKTLGIPLGLQNVDMWGKTDKDHLRQCASTPKTKLLYFNFRVATNPTVRGECERHLLAQGYVKNEGKPWKEYIQELAQYKYCASPDGNGVDSHRTWECIALGVTPILLKNPIMYHWFKDLPILWVDSYENLNLTL